MKKRGLSLLLALILFFTAAAPIPVSAAVTTQRESADFLLHWIGYTDEQIAAGGGVDRSAAAIGLVQDYIPDAPCSNDQYEAMRQRALVIMDTDPLPEIPPYTPEPTDPTEPSEPSEPSEPETEPTDPSEPETQPTDPTEPEPQSPMVWQDGLAQPVFNIDRDIERFCVYVETDYDTDADGKLDLIKVLVQLPTAAMNGEYKAGVIYEARPYIAGKGSQPGASGSCSEADLYKTAPNRTVNGSRTTAQVAADARSGDYDFYENLDWYDYFLVRGFAVVTAAGLGTRGSEGYETCGTDLEIDAFASVIEWLNGQDTAVAFTDRSSNLSVDADWSNGKVGMTGRSYAGTTQFGLASTGVQGLETIVPVSGIASWYEYTNSQGYRTRNRADYSTWLASYCASRVLDGGWNKGRYGAYLNSISGDEKNLYGDYGKHFERRDYTLNPNIQCSALIVQGLNDDNVRSKHMQLMYDAFRNAGKNVKILAHQDGHVTPAYGANKTEQFINGEAYQQVLNRWFSHYLFSIANGAENMAAVTAQDNYDASKWHLYDSYPTVKEVENSTCSTLTMTSSSMKVSSGFTVMGTVPVTVKATPRSTSRNNLLHVELVDTADSYFTAYRPSGSYTDSYHRSVGTFEVGGGAQNYTVVELRGTSTREKVIAEGWMDLSNPGAGFLSATATPESIRSGQQYTYTVYLQANVYRVAPGHTLKLRVSASSGSVQSYSAAVPTVEAVTAPATYAVSYAASENGSVISDIPSGEQVCADTAVTMTAAPEAGFVFAGWEINGSAAEGSETATFTITGDTSILALFEREPAPQQEESQKPAGRPVWPGLPSWPRFPVWPWRTSI